VSALALANQSQQSVLQLLRWYRRHIRQRNGGGNPAVFFALFAWLCWPQLHFELDDQTSAATLWWSETKSGQAPVSELLNRSLNVVR